MRFLLVYDTPSACSHYRLRVPGTALQALGHEARLSEGEIHREDLLWCDTVVFQRICDPRADQAVCFAQEHGKLAVFDLDDDLWTLDPTNPAAGFWTPAHLADMERIIRRCDRVTTTTAALAERMRRFSRDVRIVPNCLPDEWECSEQPEHPLTIGWAGGTSHMLDFEAITETLTSVLEQRRHVRVELCGGHPSWWWHPRSATLEPVPIEQYAGLLSRFDIGIAPIRDTTFNRAKSELKPLEYAGCGIPFVASKVGRYDEVITHGEQGFLARSHADWTRQLLRLVDDAELRREMGARGLAWARTRTVGRHVSRWEKAWSQGH